MEFNITMELIKITIALIDKEKEEKVKIKKWKVKVDLVNKEKHIKKLRTNKKYKT